MHTLLFGIICFLVGPIALYFAARYFPKVRRQLFDILESITEKQIK